MGRRRSSTVTATIASQYSGWRARFGTGRGLRVDGNPHRLVLANTSLSARAYWVVRRRNARPPHGSTAENERAFRVLPAVGQTDKQPDEPDKLAADSAHGKFGRFVRRCP